MRKKKTKENETRIDSYGRSEVLDEQWRENPPERELWASVIYQAILNIQFKISGWESDLFFIRGGMGFNWICEQLGLNPYAVSQGAIQAALNNNFKHKKRR